MSHSLVSIIVATYNGERYIGEQLESLLAQTYPAIEIIVSDDGSTDKTLDIVEAFRQKAPSRVIVHRNAQQLGYADNFLTATRNLASGDIIAFCDQDDIWHPDKCQKCVDALVKNDAVLCAHTLNKIDHDGKFIAFFDQGIKADTVYEPMSLEPWGVFFGLSVVFKKSLLDIIPAERRGLDVWDFDKPLAHDRWIYYLGNHLGRVVTISEPLASYRQHQTNLFGHQKRSFLEKLFHKVDEDSKRHQHLARIARQRMQQLRDYAEVDHPSHDLMLRAAERWDRLAAIFEKRAALVKAGNVLGRAYVSAGLIWSGAYAPLNRGGIGRRKLAIDLLSVGFGARPQRRG